MNEHEEHIMDFHLFFNVVNLKLTLASEKV